MVSVLKHFTVDTNTHPKVLEYWGKWKEDKRNISHKICKLIEQEGVREEERQRKLHELGLAEE
jgi:hypothetical protein